MAARKRHLREFGIIVISLALIVVCTACFGSSNPQDTMSPRGPVARDQKALFYPVFWIAVAIFFVVEAMLIFAVFRFRHRRGSDVIPRQVHGNTRIEIAWTIAPTLLLAFISIPTVAMIYNLAPKTVDNPLKVTVVGHQWWWEFQYPDLGVVTANELHIPTNRRVNLTLNSIDVIHAFYVPQLAGQLDVVPGHNNEMWLQADHAGDYSGQCTQFCGTSHAFMRFRVISQEPNDFETWVSGQKGPPVAPTADTQAGAKAFATGACIGCHTIEGVSQGKVGPNLTHFASRTTFAGSSLPNEPADVAKWIKNPQSVKPDAKMPNLHLDDATIADLVKYLESLK